MRGHFVRIVAGKIERVPFLRKGRHADRAGRHQRSAGRCGDLAEVVTSPRMPHQVPAAGFEAAVADIDDAVTSGYRRARRDEGFEPDQQRFAAGITGLCHVVVGRDYVTDPHPPGGAEIIREIELGNLATVTRIDPDQARGVALDGGQQHLATAGGARDRGQAAQPGFGVAGIAVGVSGAPLRLRPVGSLIDLLADSRVEPAVALGKAADPQLSVATR